MVDILRNGKSMAPGQTIFHPPQLHQVLGVFVDVRSGDLFCRALSSPECQW